MPPTPAQAYESLVHNLIDELTSGAASFSGAQVAGGVTNKVAGASGFDHQIDVSVLTPTDLAIVECKHWSDPIDAEPVLAFAARLSDIRAANPGLKIHASLVSTKYATRGATKLAEYFGVSLDVVLNECEFAVRLHNCVFAGIVETIHASATCDATVIRGNGG